MWLSVYVLAAGVREGDRVVAIDGVDMHRRSTDELAHAGTRILGDKRSSVFSRNTHDYSTLRRLLELRTFHHARVVSHLETHTPCDAQLSLPPSPPILPLLPCPPPRTLRCYRRRHTTVRRHHCTAGCTSAATFTAAALELHPCHGRGREGDGGKAGGKAGWGESERWRVERGQSRGRGVRGWGGGGVE